MNEDVSKSFHCKESGCEMSFFNEHNLSVHHQSKHSKLNLEIPSKDITINFSTDLTPTPTKFLNKCEELRVFEDPYIQNINPFDEGFRNAIDNRNGGFLSVSPTTATNQDTLHTPQIIPDFITRNIKDERIPVDLPMQDEPENLSTTPDVIPNIPKITISEPIPLLPKPNIIYAAPLITATKSNETVKDRLKNIILSNNNGPTTTTVTSIAHESHKRIKLDTTDTKLNLPAILIQTVPLIAPTNVIKLKINDTKSTVDLKKDNGDNSTKKKSTSNKSDSAALKVERNRAAARRYRHKMKQQSQALREKYDKSLKEIAQLKKDITELKKLLLLHKDCEVTKRLNLTN
ncbi:hypothetical protein PVAND_013034 [Polypedilum vanderplanki]|uniref:C2H2-type domain-containing protein n=1 Tax=Polypedilum vanderplanki TaxID=319348 RepID=A0A9J6CN95_POLVA|nr:hypothetical protein PVAND_013034 [Polypedilum vanderplanki]